MSTVGTSFRSLWLPLLFVAWVCAVTFGWWALWQFEFTPGVPAKSPLNWPTNSSIVRSAERERLLIFVHPKCGCTRATIGELSELLARMPGPLDVSLLFLCPARSDPQWARGELWDMATGISGVEVREDFGGAEARRFGVSTSGQALLYDRAGNLLLATGLTASRGHAGPNPGRASLERLLIHQTYQQDERAMDVVFGCPLSNKVRNFSAGTDVQ